MLQTIFAIILGIVSLVCFVLGYRQLKEKGALLNNAYSYASEAEREKMNKKPYYRQSGIIFILIGVIFAVNAVEVKLMLGWLLWLVMALVVITLAYAIASSVKINKNNKQ